MKIDQFFQKGYYINLERRPERRVAFGKEVENLNLVGFFERYLGVDDIPTARAINPWEPSYVWSGMCCSKAFHNVFAQMKADNVERGLVCEDDAHFLDGGLSTIEAALDQIEQFPDWDLLYLGGLVKDHQGIQVSENLLRVEKVLTMHAVGVNRKCLDEILTYRPYHDSIYDGWMAHRTSLKKYLVYPKSVIQNEGPSDIDASGHSLLNKNWDDSYDKLKIVK